MKRYDRYELAPEAVDDIDEVRAYIAADSLDAADAFIDRLRDAMRLLAGQPRIGHPRPDLTRRKLLFWPVGNYLIVYWPARQPLGIVAVLHGARDGAAILKDRL